MKILIAEDDRTSRLFMTKFLSRYGTCYHALNGLEAIDIFEESLKDNKAFDLVCMDIMMPKVDGIKTLQAIRELEKKYKFSPCKVIMTSALSDEGSVSESYALGCDAYIWKPIDIKKFSQKLKEMGLIE